MSLPRSSPRSAPTRIHPTADGPRAVAFPRPVGLILAGGLSRRMGGGDKSLNLLADRPILAHIVSRLGPQVACLVLSANGDPARFASFGLPVLPDELPDYPGPLAGILAGLDHAAGDGHQWLVSVPADAPFLPLDLVTRLHQARHDAQAPLAIAASADRIHPVAALWPVTMRDQIRAALTRGQRRVTALTADAAIATWPDTPIDPFLNINTQADLEAAEALIADVRKPPPRPLAEP